MTHWTKGPKAEETKAKLRSARLRQPCPRTGRKHSDKSKEQMSLAKRGRKLSEAHKMAIGDAFRGRPLSPEHRAKVAKANRSRPCPFTGVTPRFAGKGKRTKYKNIVFRSTYEARFAKACDYLSVKWEYEPERFKLTDRMTYLPDFYFPEQDCYIEIKGWIAPHAMERIEAFRSKYETPLLLITQAGLLAYEHAAYN